MLFQFVLVQVSIALIPAEELSRIDLPAGKPLPLFQTRRVADGFLRSCKMLHRAAVCSIHPKIVQSLAGLRWKHRSTRHAAEGFLRGEACNDRDTTVDPIE